MENLFRSSVWKQNQMENLHAINCRHSSTSLSCEGLLIAIRQLGKYPTEKWTNNTQRLGRNH